MSITRINDALRAAGSHISKTEVGKLFEAARDEGGIDAAEKARLQQILTTHGNRFSRLSRGEFEKQLNGSAPVVVPTEPTKVIHKADRSPWTTTYWPMASSDGDTNGSASSNLWAKDGPLQKFDALLKARGKPEGARAHELKPALNWLLQDSKIMKGKTRSETSGEWIADSNLSEKDAERTTGVDFNGNKKIDADVKWDFLDSRGNFGTDGKTEGSMGVGWWGSCDKVALAGILFKEPKKSVTLDGVTFTAQDIKGLLTVIADSQGGGTDFVGNRYDARPDVVRLKNGQELQGKITTEVEWNAAGVRHQEDYTIAAKLPDELKITLLDGTEKTVKKADLALVAREDQKDEAALFHKTIGDWLKSGRPAAMDKDSGDHVWNYSFHQAEDTLYANGLKPSWATADFKLSGWNGPAGDGKITYVEREVQFGDGGMSSNYQYWLEEKNGKVVNSGWGPSSSSPDFLWRPRTEADFTGSNDRNRFVDPKLVKELYEKSIG